MQEQLKSKRSAKLETSLSVKISLENSKSKPPLFYYLNYRNTLLTRGSERVFVLCLQKYAQLSTWSRKPLYLSYY